MGLCGSTIGRVAVASLDRSCGVSDTVLKSSARIGGSLGVGTRVRAARVEGTDVLVRAGVAEIARAGVAGMEDTDARDARSEV